MSFIELAQQNKAAEIIARGKIQAPTPTSLYNEETDLASGSQERFEMFQNTLKSNKILTIVLLIILSAIVLIFFLELK